ncbi:MAG TPA: amidohydrolase family protein [Actinomycetota bacterium]
MTTRLLLRGGTVLALGAKAPNLAQGDVLIEDGRVAEVGRGLRARDAETVDATDTIVMPGFVDAHRHCWRSLFRNLGSAGDPESRAASAVDASHYRPDDVYAATLIGLLGAVEAGVTTVVDHCDLPLDDASADAALRAHADAGLRTVFVVAPLEPPSRELLERLRDAAGPRTTLAVGTSALGAGAAGAAAAALAGDLGLRLHVHGGLGASAPGVVAGAAAGGLLGDHVTLVHHTRVDDADLDAVSSSGAAVTLGPSSEMAGGLGAPPIQELLDHGLRPALGIDDERVAPGDMFAQMRQTISLQHATVFDRKLMGKAGLPRLMTTRDVIRYATVEGARAAGLGGVVGSLEPGMHADVIALRTDRPNVWPINDPIGAVVWGMDTSNVDHVLVAGRPLVRGGALEADVAAARELATAARERVAAAAGVAVGAATGGER